MRATFPVPLIFLVSTWIRLFWKPVSADVSWNERFRLGSNGWILTTFWASAQRSWMRSFLQFSKVQYFKLERKTTARKLGVIFQCWSALNRLPWILSRSNAKRRLVTKEL
jgi:hypothetical protein